MNQESPVLLKGSLSEESLFEQIFTVALGREKHRIKHTSAISDPRITGSPLLLEN